MDRQSTARFCVALLASTLAVAHRVEGAPGADVLIAEDGPYAERAFERSYRDRLASVLLPDDGKILSYVGEGGIDVEESVYVTRSERSGDCKVHSIRLRHAFRPIYGRAFERQSSRSEFRGIVDTDLPPRDEVAASLGPDDCSRVLHAWAAALSRVQSLSDWVNLSQDCRSATSGCQHVFPLPHAKIRYLHYACYRDVGNSAGYILSNGGPRGWSRLEGLTNALVVYAKAADGEPRSVARAHILATLADVEESYHSPGL